MVLALSRALLRLTVFAQGVKATARSTAPAELSLSSGLFSEWIGTRVPGTSSMSRKVEPGTSLSRVR